MEVLGIITDLMIIAVCIMTFWYLKRKRKQD